MATIRTILLKDNANKKKNQDPDCNKKDSVWPVYVQVSDRGERTVFNTGFSATKEEFDESKNAGRFLLVRGKASVIKKILNKEELLHPIYSEVESIDKEGKKTKSTEVTGYEPYTKKIANDEIAQIETDLKSRINGYEKNGVQWSMEMLRNDYLAKPSKKTFYAYAQEKADKYRAEGRYKKAQILTETLKSMELYDPKFKALKFQDITTAYLKKYIDAKQRKGNRGNTIAVRLCEIRTILNDAIANGEGCLQTYPFGSERDRKISIKGFKESETEKDNFLPMKYLGIFAKAELPTLRQQTAQHLFLLSYFCNGANWRDMAYWTNDNITTTETIDLITGDTLTADIISYTRGKTKKRIEIPLTDEIRRELDWFKANTELFKNYLLPIILKDEDPAATLQHVSDARCRYNLTLHSITALLEFPGRFQDIAAYTARHTFAVALQVQGATAAQIGHDLGHRKGDTETQKNYTAKTQDRTKVLDPTK